MFKISLRLVSDDGNPAEVTSLTGMRPDIEARAGENSRRTGKPHKFSSWSVSVGSESLLQRPEEAFDALVSWGLPVARKFHELCSKQGWEMSLIIVQEFRDADDVTEKGISLSPEVIEWLAVAGAGVEIDQYIYR